VEQTDTNYYEPYAFFARTVRTWFIAYGIGGPVLLFGNGEAWKSLMAKGAAPTVIRCFLVGVALQVVTGIIFKAAMWYLYVGELGVLKDTSKRYRAADWLSSAYWPEVLVEFLTLSLFTFATWKALVVLGAA
jgi:hypothetical protein